MFYPAESLKRGGRFYLCWLADSWPERFATISQRQVWSHDVRKICDDLLHVMTNESGRPVNRFSLRLSSQLLRGLVRLYQRKVSLYLVDLCMTNASVFRHANKKWHIAEVTLNEHALQPLLILEQPQEVVPEPENEQQIAQLIQNSGNVVDNIQDITLKESAIPDYQLPSNDGFGEEHPGQALQLLVDRTIETMLHADAPAQQLSARGAALDVSELDKSRLAAHDLQMEAAAELDLTMFRKSTNPDLLAAGDFEKDHPLEEQAEISRMQTIPEPPAEIELQELEEPPTKRRRMNKLIIDKNTKISANILHARINNPTVELRCEDPTDDVIQLRLPVDLYFRRPAHGGYKFKYNIANAITRLFLRNLGVVANQLAVKREMEEPRIHRSLRPRERSVLERIEEEIVVQGVLQPTHQPVDQQVEPPGELDTTKEAAGVLIDQPMQPEQPVQIEVDISDMPTQKLDTLSQAEKRKSDVDTLSRKRLRASDFASFRLSQQLAIEAEVATAEAEKENIPHPLNQQSPTKSPNKSQRTVLSMLEQAGLADVCEPRVTETNPESLTERTAKRGGSEGSETPLGSLDRTKVSLGDSDKTTDSIRQIREQWGTVGTMTKIMKAIKRGPKQPITVWYLMNRGPILQEYKNVIAARCFSSILKLKHHGFIIVRKDPETLEIRDIILGPRFD
ncbi:uncharacterized protein LOC106130853 [Amyelois transitella]|uniref:uncharacterized protein LOC106130853 n=1 Tax=Amyelois transitella TaxID=680683 RepID=UPI00298F6EA6|nr:uncharacterized protein LOC106130853 [Amyelois transitella]